MPRTTGRGRRVDPNADPVRRCSRLPCVDKLICWHCYQFTATEGENGWNPTEAGSVFHCRASDFVQSQGSANWFRHKAQAMVTLAQAFAARDQAPEEPVAPPQAPAAAAARPQPRMASPPTLPNLQSPQGRFGTPVHGGTPAVPPPAVDQRLQAPMCFGMHRHFNYTTRKTTSKMLIRMILHNGLNALEDIEFEWITPRNLKVPVAWPDWFQMAEQMAQFTLDEHGNMLFPPEHSLTMDASERNQALVEEDNKIWDYGHLEFD